VLGLCESAGDLGLLGWVGHHPRVGSGEDHRPGESIGGCVGVGRRGGRLRGFVEQPHGLVTDQPGRSSTGGSAQESHRILGTGRRRGREGLEAVLRLLEVTAQDERLGEVLAERADLEGAGEGGAHLDRQLVEALTPQVVVLRGRQ
jgi:hypothetical protein